MTRSAVLLLLQLFALASLVLAAAIDVKMRIMPNGLALCVLVAGLAMRLLDSGLEALVSIAIALATLFALGVLARRGDIGGGDAKTIAAATLLVAPSQVLTLFTTIALAGGVLAVLYAAGRAALRQAKRRRLAALAPDLGTPPPVSVEPGIVGPIRESDRDQLPYGLAILAGTILAIWPLP